MSARHIDLTKPETIKRLAALPHYGQAISVLRGPFPEWGLDPEVVHIFTVRLEREELPACQCNCPHCHRDLPEISRKSVEVEAFTIEEANAIALTDNPTWDVFDCRLSNSVSLDVPEWVYETAGAA